MKTSAPVQEHLTVIHRTGNVLDRVTLLFLHFFSYLEVERLRIGIRLIILEFNLL